VQSEFGERYQHRGQRSFSAKAISILQQFKLLPTAYPAWTVSATGTISAGDAQSIFFPNYPHGRPARPTAMLQGYRSYPAIQLTPKSKLSNKNEYNRAAFFTGVQLLAAI
jgi:hypothetical protein